MKGNNFSTNRLFRSCGTFCIENVLLSQQTFQLLFFKDLNNIQGGYITYVRVPKSKIE